MKTNSPLDGDGHRGVAGGEHAHLRHRDGVGYEMDEDVVAVAAAQRGQREAGSLFSDDVIFHVRNFQA